MKRIPISTIVLGSTLVSLAVAYPAELAAGNKSDRGASVADRGGVSLGGGTSVSADRGGVSVGGGTSVSADRGGVSVGGGTSVSVDRGGVSVGSGTSASVDRGGVSVGGGTSASVDRGGVSVGGGGTSVSADRGGVSVGGGTSASVDRGGVSVGGGTSASADRGGVSVGGTSESADRGGVNVGGDRGATVSAERSNTVSSGGRAPAPPAGRPTGDRSYKSYGSIVEWFDDLRSSWFGGRSERSDDAITAHASATQRTETSQSGGGQVNRVEQSSIETATDGGSAVAKASNVSVIEQKN